MWWNDCAVEGNMLGCWEIYDKVKFKAKLNKICLKSLSYCYGFAAIQM